MVASRTGERGAYTSDHCTIQFETKVRANGRSALVRITDFSQPAIRVELPFESAAGDAVEMELADSTVYGILIHSRKTKSSCEAGIQVARVVLGDTALADLLQRVLAEQIPLLPGLDIPTGTHTG
jgi:hypothetical protein